MKTNISKIQWSKPVEQLINQKILGKDTMEFIANEAKDIMTPFVPMDTGNLSNDENATVKKDDVNIIAGETIAAIHYTAPYAAAVYYNNRGVTFKKTHHPLASAKWDRVAMESGGKDRLIAALKKRIRKKG